MKKGKEHEQHGSELNLFLFDFEQRLGVFHVIYEFPVFGVRDLSKVRPVRDMFISLLRSKGYKVRVVGLDQFRVSQIKPSEVLIVDISETPPKLLKQSLQGLNLSREQVFAKSRSTTRIIFFDPLAEMPKLAHDFYTWLPIGYSLNQMTT